MSQCGTGKSARPRRNAPEKRTTVVMDIEKITIGCSVFGIDARTIDAAQMARLKDLLYRHRLVVLKEQTLTDAGYCDFARRLGTPVPYLQEHYRHPEFPLIFVSSNVKKDGKQI